MIKQCNYTHYCYKITVSLFIRDTRDEVVLDLDENRMTKKATTPKIEIDVPFMSSCTNLQVVFQLLSSRHLDTRDSIHDSVG